MFCFSNLKQEVMSCLALLSDWSVSDVVILSTGMLPKFLPKTTTTTTGSQKTRFLFHRFHSNNF